MSTQIPRRARTEEQKLFRRKAILEAADQHFRDAGFEAFSMAKLAKQAGVAKGTLYLYFGSREEVFLVLYVEQIERWAKQLIQSLTANMSNEDFATTFLKTARYDPVMIPLLLRLDHVIEHNVSISKLIESKRALRTMLDEISVPVASALGLEQAQAFDATTSLAALLLGSSRIDEGPDLQDEDLPDDVLELISLFSSDETFITNACRILTGIRAGN